MRRPTAGLACALALAAGTAGCGGEMEDERHVPDAEVAAGGTLVYAIPAAPATVDPLRAADPISRLVSRQVHEPLVEEVAPALGEGARRRGLALAWSPSADATEWRLRLRRRVRFQDGAVLNGAAVVVNARRWQTLVEGRALLPGLETADAPRTTVVRFVFDRPVPDLPRRLSDAALGIVSPEALDPPSGESAVLGRLAETGTGPFELREHNESELVMAANVAWWGTGVGLGPGLDQLRFRIVRDEEERFDLLRRGEAQVAASLDRRAASSVARDPLLALIQGPGAQRTGVERSVRGVEPEDPPRSLSSAWLTRVDGG